MNVLLTHVSLCIPGGSEVVLVMLARALHEAGHDVRVFSPAVGQVGKRLIAAGVRVADDLDRLAPTDWRPDVVHAMHVKHTLDPALKRWPKARTVCTCHGIVPIEGADRRCKLVVVVSDEVRDRVVVRDGVAARRVRVVHNGVDAGLHVPGPYKPKGPLVYWGRVMSDHAQTMRVVIQAAKAVGRPVQLHGVSMGGIETAMLKYGRRLGVSVTYHGMAWSGLSAFRAASVVVANGRCALEAMLSGTPTWIRGDGGADGFLFDEGRVRGSSRCNFSGRARIRERTLIEDLKQLHPARAREKTLKIRPFVVKHFGAKAMIDGYKRVYRELCVTRSS